MKQDGHFSTALPNLVTITNTFFQLLTTLAPQLLQPSDSLNTVNELLRIIQFNSQSFVIPELPNTSLMCHFNSLSKLNHSCVPNAILALSITHSSSSSRSTTKRPPERQQQQVTAEENGRGVHVSGALIPLRHIQPGEELCISYLSQLCISIEHRQNLLQQGFLFTCYCPRCILEQSILLSPHTTSTTEQSFDFRTLDLGNYHPIVSHLQSLNKVSQQLQMIQQKHLNHLQEGLQTLLNIQQKLSTSSSRQQLNKTIVKNVYLLHEATMSLLDVTMAVKPSVITPNDTISWDIIAVRLIDILHQ